MVLPVHVIEYVSQCHGIPAYTNSICDSDTPAGLQISWIKVSDGHDRMTLSAAMVAIAATE